MALSPSQTRVVDPILSNHARGYRNAEYVGDKLFPIVGMPTRAAKRIEFGKEGFRQYNTRRAPGGRIARLEFGFEGKPVALSQYALAAQVPIEHVGEAAEGPGIDLQTIATNLVLDVIALQREIAQASAARTAASYAASNKIALAGANKWSDDGSDPGAQVDVGKEVIRQGIGRRPNVLMLGGALATRAARHPKILDKFKYTSSDTVTLQQLATYFGVAEVVAGDGIYQPAAGGAMVDIWGNDAVLAYVAPSSTAQMATPSYGYTYRLNGHPAVSPSRWDGDTRSWVNDVVDEWSPELVGVDAGYLIQAAL